MYTNSCSLRLCFSEASQSGIPSCADMAMQLHTKLLRLLSLLCGDPTVMQDKVRESCHCLPSEMTEHMALVFSVLWVLHIHIFVLYWRQDIGGHCCSLITSLCLMSCLPSTNSYTRLFDIACHRPFRNPRLSHWWLVLLDSIGMSWDWSKFNAVWCFCAGHVLLTGSLCSGAHWEQYSLFLLLQAQ